jgi:hypothetical protein
MKKLTKGKGILGILLTAVLLCALVVPAATPTLAADEVVWQYSTGLNKPHDAERLSNGNTLITDMYNDRAIEVDLGGNIVWEYSGLNTPRDAERLSNGNTLITDSVNYRVIEVDPDKNIVWEYSTGTGLPEDVERLSNGNTLIAYSNSNRVIEVATLATMSISPPAQIVNPGDTFTVDVVLAINGLTRAAQCDLSFDASLVQVDSVTEGSYYSDWATAHGGTTYFNTETIDNTVGTVTGAGVSILGGGSGGQTGSGVFITLNMTAKTGVSGTSLLHLFEVIVADENAGPMPGVVINAGEVVVQDTLTISDSPAEGGTVTGWSSALSGSQNPTTIVWEYSELFFPADARRLSNGNTLIADCYNHRVIEVDPGKNIVWQYTTGLGYPCDAERLSNGNTLIADSGHYRVIEVDPSGNIVWEYSIYKGYPCDAQRLSNGNTLITDSGHNRVIEVATFTSTSISPPTQTVNSGDTFTVDVVVDLGRRASLAAQCDLSFDPLLVQVNSVTEGTLYSGGGTTDFNPGEIDNVNGTVTGIGVNIPEGTAVTGAGTFVTINMTAKTGVNGTSLLALSGVIVSDENAVAIPDVAINDGVVVVITPHYTLTTSASPLDGGTVTGGGTYDCGATATVEAIPAGGSWYFAGWSGDLSGSENPTILYMDSDKSVTANFSIMVYGVIVFDSWKSWQPERALGEPDGIGAKIRSSGAIIVELSDIITEATMVTVTAAKGRGKWDPTFSVFVSADGTEWTPVGGGTCTIKDYIDYGFTGEFGNVKFIKVERPKERGQLYIDAVFVEHIQSLD